LKKVSLGSQSEIYCAKKNGCYSVVIMTIVTYNKIKNELKKELIMEFINPLLTDLKDAEGTYKESFVADVLKASREKPTHRFKESYPVSLGRGNIKMCERSELLYTSPIRSNAE
jgi:hypothetical protein